MKNWGFSLAAALSVAAFTPPAAAGPVQKVIQKIIERRGLDQAKQLETYAGLKITRCRLNGKRYRADSESINYCLFQALRDFDRHSVATPVDVEVLSLASKRTFRAQMTWRPYTYQLHRGTVKRRAFGIYYRVKEIRGFLKHYLENEFILDVEPAVTVGDVRIQGDARVLRPFQSIDADRVVMSTFATPEKTLAGHVDFLRKKAEADGSDLRILTLDYRTSWNLKDSKEVRGRMQGELYPDGAPEPSDKELLGTNEEEAELRAALEADETEAAISGEAP